MDTVVANIWYGCGIVKVSKSWELGRKVMYGLYAAFDRDAAIRE